MSERGNTPAEDEAIGCFTEGTITRVDAPSQPGGSWSITYADGWGCGLRGDLGAEPKVGDHFRTYGRFGRSFHGQALNGRLLWYKSAAEMDAEHAAWLAQHNADRAERFERERPQLDADYHGLPWVLKKRIDRFRAANPNFRVEYESYEMFVCTQAVALAGWAETQTEPVAAIDSWKDQPYEVQVESVPEWSDAHSGNTHGCAVALAETLCTSNERAAVLPGALSPIVGTADYAANPAPSPSTQQAPRTMENER